MPMGSDCEVCGKQPPITKTGPFAGSRGMFDYCEFCSKDLCDECMAEGKCRESKDGKHFTEPEDE